MSTNPESRDIQERALAWCNEIRAEFELPPAAALQPGILHEPCACVLHNTITAGTDLVCYAGWSSIMVNGWALKIPADIAEFIASAAARGTLPELDITSRKHHAAQPEPVTEEAAV